MTPATSCLLALAACAVSCSGGATATGDAGAAASDAAATRACPAAAPDARVACAGGESTCDYFLNCGCDSTEKCSAGASGPACTPVGAKAPGTTCGGDSECARGTVCVPFFDAVTCMQFCDAAHGCPSGQACYVIVNDREQPGRQIGEVCGPTCSLLDQDCATVGLGCYRSDKHCAPEEGLCLSAGTGGQGAACARMSDCQKGLLCVNPGGPPAPICAKICDRKDGVPACSAGTLCRELPEQSQTGVCLP